VNLPADIARCVGREIPFGMTNCHPECQSCDRNTAAWVPPTPLMGPVRFDGKCPFKIKDETE